MKISVDVDALVKSGVISDEVAATLRQHSLKNTGALAINMLLAFGAIAIAGGLLILLPEPYFAALLGVGFIIAGIYFEANHSANWGKLGQVWTVVGTLIFIAGAGYYIPKAWLGGLFAAAVLAGMGAFAKSRLLVALVPLAILGTIGGSTGYWHASYSMTIKEPTLTILLFGVLALVSWHFVKRCEGVWQDLLVVFARVCVLLVNFGFWVGSLWGDKPGSYWDKAPRGNLVQQFDKMQNEFVIPDVAFSVVWAVALVAAGIWAAKNNRKFLVNTVVVFGAIHFYTQWFEVLGLHSVSVIVAGVATVLVGLWFWRYNQQAA